MRKLTLSTRAACRPGICRGVGQYAQAALQLSDLKRTSNSRNQLSTNPHAVPSMAYVAARPLWFWEYAQALPRVTDAQD